MWSNRENYKEDSERSKLSNSISNRSQGIVFHRRQLFSGGPFTRSKRTPVDVWSNHACQVAVFFPGVRTAPLVGLSTSFFPGLRKCTPRQKVHVNQQAASFQRPPKMSAQVVWLSLDWARHAPYLDKVRLRGSCWTFMSKGQSSSQSSRVRRGPETGKKQRQRQATHPEENRQRE